MDKESLIILILTTLCWGQLVPTTDRIKKLYIENSYVVESDGKGRGGKFAAECEGYQWTESKIKNVKDLISVFIMTNICWLHFCDHRAGLGSRLILTANFLTIRARLQFILLKISPTLRIINISYKLQTTGCLNNIFQNIKDFFVNFLFEHCSWENK